MTSPPLPNFPIPPFPAPFYSWGAAPPPPAPPTAPAAETRAVPPSKPGPGADYTRHALDTVAAAAEAVASKQDRLPRGPGLAGVKRPGLAGELLAGGAAVHHTGWVELWDTEMPAELVRLCRPLHCQLCNSQATSPGQARMHYQVLRTDYKDEPRH